MKQFFLMMLLVCVSKSSFAEVLVRVEPMSLMYGIPGGSLELGLGRRFTIGFGYQYFINENHIRSLSVHEYSLLSTIHLTNDRSEDGWIVQPAVRHYDNIDERDLERKTIDQQGWYLTATGGYEWIWTSGFNVCLGAGLSVGLDSVSRREVDPLLNWQLGWAF